MAESPARSYNPLFIYGPAGLGKTHLLHAIGHHVRDVFRKQAGPLRLHRDVHERVRRRDPDQRRCPRSSGATASSTCCSIDDIQFLERTQELQEEFFHTFNQLHGEGGQIVHLVGPAAEVDRHASRTASAPASSGV